MGLFLDIQDHHCAYLAAAVPLGCGSRWKSEDYISTVLGLDALIISVAGTVGSCFFAWMLWKYIQIKKK